MKTPKILVVDDERSVRQAIRFELEEDGYEVHYASNFLEAFELFHNMGADIIITDLFLEKGNGVDLIQKIKSENDEQPVIVITAYPESELGQHAKSIVKDRFHVKPFFMDQLKTQVTEILGKQPVTFAS